VGREVKGDGEGRRAKDVRRTKRARVAMRISHLSRSRALGRIWLLRPPAPLHIMPHQLQYRAKQKGGADGVVEAETA